MRDVPYIEVKRDIVENNIMIVVTKLPDDRCGVMTLTSHNTIPLIDKTSLETLDLAGSIPRWNPSNSGGRSLRSVVSQPGLIAYGQGNMLQTARLENGGEIVGVFPESRNLYCLCEVPTQNTLIGSDCSYTRQLKCFDISTQQKTSQYSVPGRGNVSRVSWLEYDEMRQTVVVSVYDNGLFLLDTRSHPATGGLSKVLNGSLNGATPIPDRNLVALMYCHSGDIELRDVRKIDHPIWKLAVACGEGINSYDNQFAGHIRISEDTFVTSHHEYPNLVKWNLEGEVLRSVGIVHGGSQGCRAMCFTGDPMPEDHIFRLFENMSSSEANARIDFLCQGGENDSFWDFQIRTGSLQVVLPCAKAFLAACSDSMKRTVAASNSFEIEDQITVTPEVFVKLLLGCPTEIPPLEMLDFYRLFAARTGEESLFDSPEVEESRVEISCPLSPEISSIL